MGRKFPMLLMNAPACRQAGFQGSKIFRIPYRITVYELLSHRGRQWLQLQVSLNSKYSRRLKYFP